MSRKNKDTTEVAPITPKPEPLWSDTATGGGRGKYLGVRWTVFVVILLVGAGMFVRALRPVNQTVINEAPEVSISSAGEYAAAFAQDWFTWDQEHPDDRTARLSAYNPALTQAGWNGRGTQHVTSARVFAEDDLGDGRFNVTVRLVVDTTPGSFYVDVLTQQTGTAFAVLSVPTLVPGPLLAPVSTDQERVTREPDASVTSDITTQLGLFFRAWAVGDDTLSAFVKAGIQVSPLGGGITFNEVSNVVVPAVAEGGDAKRRTVTADVVWNWPGGGGATAPATYVVDVERVAGKWYVTRIKGGALDAAVAPSSGQSSVVTPGATASSVPNSSGAGTGQTPAPSVPSTPATSSDGQAPSGSPSSSVTDNGQIVDSSLPEYTNGGD